MYLKCNKTFESTSSLFIEYTKDYPNFLIDNDTKYRVGEHPKKEDKDIWEEYEPDWKDLQAYKEAMAKWRKDHPNWKDKDANKMVDSMIRNFWELELVLYKDFSNQDFISNPHEYRSKIKKYLLNTDMLLASHYWDPKSPKLFTLSEINEFKNLKIVGDITCDINGSVPTTIRPTSIAKPYYSIDKNSFQEISLGDKGIAVMAVDNLPSELSRDSSEEFGNSILSEVLPYLINQDDGRINRATTASKGELYPSFSYLKDFIR